MLQSLFDNVLMIYEGKIEVSRMFLYFVKILQLNWCYRWFCRRQGHNDYRYFYHYFHYFSLLS